MLKMCCLAGHLFCDLHAQPCWVWLKATAHGFVVAWQQKTLTNAVLEGANNCLVLSGLLCGTVILLGRGKNKEFTCFFLLWATGGKTVDFAQKQSRKNNREKTAQNNSMKRLCFAQKQNWEGSKWISYGTLGGDAKGWWEFIPRAIIMMIYTGSCRKKIKAPHHIP